MSKATHRARASGFTLVELLVVVGIVALLIAILAPVIVKAKRHAEAAAGTANMRSLGQTMLMYTGSYRDEFLNPFGTSPNGFGYAVSPLDPELEWNFSVPDAPKWTTELFAYYWYSYLAEIDGQARFRDEQFSPADAWMHSLRKQKSKSDEVRVGTALWPSSFLYSPTFWFDSRRFGTTRSVFVDQHLGTQFTQSVAFPSQKVLVFERMDFDQRTRLQATSASSAERVGRPPGWHNIRSITDVFTVDGAVRAIHIADIFAAPDGFRIPRDAIANWDQPGLTPRDGTPQLDDPYPVVGIAEHNNALFWATPDGVEGRDFLE